MSEFNVNVESGTSVRLQTAGKYCDRDILVTAEGGGELPTEAFAISGSCNYRFAYNHWNWFIDTYGSAVTTDLITSAQYMFASSTNLTKIPFKINFRNSATGANDMSYMFYYCNKLEEIPKINNPRVGARNNIFSNCYMVRSIPDSIFESWDWSYLDSLATSYSANASSMFQRCYSLRQIPMVMMSHANKMAGYSYSHYCQAFELCFALDEIVDLPVLCHDAAWTSNTFSNTFTQCSRVKNITFALNNGEPHVVKWKGQTIDLTAAVGFAQSDSDITAYNSGITADKKVHNASTYQALKNDPDWYTINVAYSRYNHDSAVATINSLPDTSAYLATAGGTNTIKFKGESGSATDGGAINTLTEEEIAVATAKGWTVTFV